MDAVFSISLPRQAHTVSVVRDVLGTLLTRMGLCQGCVDDFLLAVSEACANAIEYGGAASDYRVEAEVDARWCEVRVSHTGRAADPSALAERFTASPPLPRFEAESGRGILLMRCLMDEVGFEDEPRVTVMLRKRRSSCDVSSEDGGGRFAVGDPSFLLHGV